MNGNVKVQLFADGTKIRTFTDNPNLIHPESIDIKITNNCDLGCAYCHEQSALNNNHADLSKLLEVIKDLPAGVELAIGGGNPLSHPDIVYLLEVLKSKGIISNITMNQQHLSVYGRIIKELINNDFMKGVGISIVNDDFTNIKQLKKISNNIVYHLIAGISDVNIIEKLIELGNAKILVLGYKKFGRGIEYYNQEVINNIRSWYMYIPRYFNRVLLSFDNLAIEQLNIRRFFTSIGWDRFYMGDDFTFTMYIDAVEQKYAPTSRSVDRVSFSDSTLLDYFQKNRKYYLVK